MIPLADEQARTYGAMVWVQLKLDGMKIPEMAKRQHLGGASLNTVVEHCQAISLLVDAGLEGSALALERSTLDAFVRGAWLLSCASDSEVDGAGQDEFPGFGDMVRALEALPRFSSGGLANLSSRVRDDLHSLTHGGTAQLLSRLGPAGIGAAFSDENKISALRWAATFAYMATIEFAILANDESLHAAAFGQLVKMQD